MSLQDTFVDNLKRFRKERHLTQEKLAEVLNIPAYYLYRPAEDFLSAKNQQMQQELISAVTQNIADIFIKHGMI